MFSSIFKKTEALYHKKQNGNLAKTYIISVTPVEIIFFVGKEIK